MSGPGGRPRGPGPRSLDALRWLARVEVAGLEALGCALGFAQSVTYSHVARLGGAGLVVRVFDPEAASRRSPPRAGERSAPIAAMCALARCTAPVCGTPERSRGWRRC